MENKSHALITLLFTGILGVITLCIFLFLNRNASDYFYYRITTFHSVKSLNKGSKVKFNGIDIGHVTELGFSKKNKGAINITLEIDQKTPITRSTYAVIAYQPVTGISSIELADNGSHSEPLITSRDTPAIIPMIDGTYHKMQARGLQIIQEIQMVTQSLSTLLNGKHQKMIYSVIHDLSDRSKKWAQTPWNIYAASVDLPEKITQGHNVINRLYQLAIDVKRISKIIDTRLNQANRQIDFEELEKITRDSRIILNNINIIMNEYKRGIHSPLIKRKIASPHKNH